MKKKLCLIPIVLASIAACGKAGTGDTASVTPALATGQVGKLSLTLTCGGATCIGTEGK